MKLAIVVQRYGADINGGAELHARYIAEHLRPHAQVEVLTTCARDYVTWRNELPPGTEEVNGIPVRRFPVRRERDTDDFGRRSRRVFERSHSFASELAWLASEGPTSPALVEHIRTHTDEIDYFIFFSYRYYHAYHGIRAVSAKSMLVPTAERDPAIGVTAFGPIFRATRALMYNSFEERAMIQAVSGNTQAPGVVVGVGSEVPDATSAPRFRQKFGISGPFVVYVGRIDKNKGCNELFEHFQRFDAAERQRLTLVLIGNTVLRVPDHPRIKHLGFVSDEDKFDAMTAARVLIMPSYFESLSMVALEAWGLGRAVLANARCDVLKGQCIRSNAGLYYDDYDEFAEALRTLTTNRSLNEALGCNGRDYFREHYAWPVIERKYLDMLNMLRHEDAAGAPRRELEPLPGWITRYRRTLPPARDVVAALPAGPSLPSLRRQSQPRQAHRRRSSPARTSRT